MDETSRERSIDKQAWQHGWRHQPSPATGSAQTVVFSKNSSEHIRGKYKLKNKQKNTHTKILLQELKHYDTFTSINICN